MVQNLRSNTTKPLPLAWEKKPGVLADRSPLEQLNIPQKNFLFPKQNLAAEQHAIQQDEVTPVRKDSNLATYNSLDSCAEPFEFPFFTHFGVVDFLTADPIDSVEPFSEDYLPWLD